MLIVEDDAFTRSLIVSALKSANFEVESVAGATKALAIFEDFHPHACILDVDLGLGPTGIDLAHAIRLRSKTVGIVFLTSFLDLRLSKAAGLALPRGSRFISKQSVGDVENLTNQVLSASLRPHVSESKGQKLSMLTSNQLEVMRLVAKGFTNFEIAQQRGSTEKATERLIARTLEKLGLRRDPKMNSRVQLVQAYAELSGKPIPR